MSPLLFRNLTEITHFTNHLPKPMFKIEYIKGSKTKGAFEYDTLEEAQNAVQENDIWNECTSYKIIDLDTGDVEEEDEFEDGSSIDAMMFPDEESREGFDVNKFYGEE